MYQADQFAIEQCEPVACSDFAIERMLELARHANVAFDVIDGRLVMKAARVDWKIWPAVRSYLDEIGTEGLKRHLERSATTQPLAA